jgi:hypothetical protein
MGRDDVRIRKVPTRIADALAAHLTSTVQIDAIFFQRVGGRKWRVYPHVDRETEKEVPEFKDVVLKFGGAAGLKPLVKHIFGIKVHDFPIPEHLRPDDEKKEWYPYADLVGWDKLLPSHVKFWFENEQALVYATEDVRHLQRLYNHWGRPAINDNNSKLAIAVACGRQRGFEVDLVHARELREKSLVLAASTPTSPGDVHAMLSAAMNPVERLALKNTSKETLRAISKWPTKAGELARNVSAARSSATKARMLKKVLKAKRLHADLKVLGAKSSRMAGRGGINVTGIEKEGETRECFRLARAGEFLDGGDFNAFEVTIADAKYEDPVLRAELQSGQKIHGLFGEQMYHKSYDDIMAQKLMGSEGLYDRAKHGVFASMYFAMAQKIAITMGITVEEAEEGLRRWESKYRRWAEARKRTFDRFCSMKQERIGAPVIWHEPDEYVETMLGYRRYFTLENAICRAVYELSHRMPPELRQMGVGYKVQRRADRVQTGLGATQSALYACAFSIQARNMRAAGNHEIQGTGAQVTKHFECKLWDEQPSGIHPWRIQVLQVHDELEACRTDVDTRSVVDGCLIDMRKVIPLLSIDWKTDVPHWGAVK